jgi:hypothetical protein
MPCNCTSCCDIDFVLKITKCKKKRVKHHRETVLCTPKKIKTNLNVTLKVLIAAFFLNLGLEGRELVAQQVNVTA